MWKIVAVSSGWQDPRNDEQAPVRWYRLKAEKIGDTPALPRGAAGTLQIGTSKHHLGHITFATASHSFTRPPQREQHFLSQNFPAEFQTLISDGLYLRSDFSWSA